MKGLDFKSVAPDNGGADISDEEEVEDASEDEDNVEEEDISDADTSDEAESEEDEEENDGEDDEEDDDGDNAAETDEEYSEESAPIKQSTSTKVKYEVPKTITTTNADNTRAKVCLFHASLRLVP